MASVKAAEREKGTVYVARVRLPGGKVATKTFDRQKDAERWAAIQEGDKARGRLPVNMTDGRTKLKEYSVRWMATRHLRQRTREGYDDLLTRFIEPTFGNVMLSRITAAAVRDWNAELLAADDKADRSHNQTAKAYRLLRTILNTAVDDGILATNPCQIRGAGLEHAEERPILDVAEVFALADAIGPRLRALVLTAAFAGLRRGELLALRRRHVDLLHRTISVEAQAIRAGANSRVETVPKTKAGRRTRPMPEFLAKELEAHLEEYTPAEPDAHVFVGAKGGPLSTLVLSLAWKDAREAVGTTATLHDLRHFAGTYYAHLGATTKEIMAHLGHSSVAAAMNYQHAAQSRAEELAGRLDVVVAAARQEPLKAPTPLKRAKNATKARNGRSA